MWKNNNFKITYTKPGSVKVENKANTYASGLVKSNYDMVKNSNDYEKILKGGCIYLPNFFSSNTDFDIFDRLKKEISEEGNVVVNWSKHFKYENPEWSKTFNYVVDKMGKHFNVTVLQSRLNYYKDGNDYKPLHKDRHAYGEGKDKIREDFTMGASFGSSRQLDFVLVDENNDKGDKFSFPQNNGDVFAFDAEINKMFMHGVPKSLKPTGERFSIIAWGTKNT